MTRTEIVDRLDVIAAGLQERLTQNARERADLTRQQSEIDSLRRTVERMAPESRRAAFDSHRFAGELVSCRYFSGHGKR